MNAFDEIERQLSESVAARAQDDAGKLLGEPIKPRRRTLVRWRPAQFALGGALAAVVLVAVLVGFGAGPGASPAAAAALERLARIAASGPSLIPGPGQYLYARSVSDFQAHMGGGGCVASAVDHRQTWVAADGSGLIRESFGPAEFTSSADRALCESAGTTSDSASGPTNNWFAAGCLTPLGPAKDINSLSTDPRTLLAQMRTIAGGADTPAEDFVHVGDFLRETDANPALRAALYRAAAQIPGVELLGTVQDHLGRHGLGVALTAGGVRSELIFNRRTAALMGEQRTGAPGANNWAVYFDSRVVDSMPYPSPLPLSPTCSDGVGHSHEVPGGTVSTGAAAA